MEPRHANLERMPDGSWKVWRVFSLLPAASHAEALLRAINEAAFAAAVSPEIAKAIQRDLPPPTPEVDLEPAGFASAGELLAAKQFANAVADEGELNNGQCIGSSCEI